LGNLFYAVKVQEQVPQVLLVSLIDAVLDQHVVVELPLIFMFLYPGTCLDLLPQFSAEKPVVAVDPVQLGPGLHHGSSDPTVPGDLLAHTFFSK
jgi:hypothetical protein